ncbi:MULTISPECIES: hypothetical protein [unclassified Streptomyces]|uniref:hypothetical protein n=1 Tax=unclassified Streptomyces TaxID=2593676 RepID=UPI00225575E2|nr:MULTISPECIES: hypothetical protein [unclassified Streptomyces]MCX4525558.1 hypothetical protein [Streptomyces sp. NBC_01551]MCX4543970.1 hypothetical protein [Streptomyces sp. NBC_01565]
MPDTFAPMRATRAAMFAAVCVALAATGHSYMSGTDIPIAGLVYAFGVIGVLAWLGAGRRRGPYGITASLLVVQGVLHLVFSGSQTAGHQHAPGPLAGTNGPAEPSGTRDASSTAGAHDMAGMHHVPSLPGAAEAPGTDAVAGMPHVPGVDGLAGMHGVGGAAAMPGTDAASGMDVAAGMPHVPGVDGLAGLPGFDGAGVMDGMAAMAGHGGLGMVVAHLLAALFCAGWLAWGESAVFRLARALGATALLAARPLARALALVRTRPAPVPPRPVFRRRLERPRRLRGAVHAHAVVRRGPPGCRVTRATAPGPLPARA